MKEKQLVNRISTLLAAKGYKVAMEVANLYRSADIALIDDEGCIWVVECKISNMAKAIEQSKTHKISADKVYIATVYKKTKETTKKKIQNAGIGLLYLMPNGTIYTELESERIKRPWPPARKKLESRIVEYSIC